METALRALAHPTRRRILELVWDAERTATEVAEHVGLSKPATSQHLRVLREVELVVVRPDRNRRLYRARLERIDEVRDFLEEFRGTRLDRLRESCERR